jgi:hypothetical protein
MLRKTFDGLAVLAGRDAVIVANSEQVAFLDFRPRPPCQLRSLVVRRQA